MTNELSERLSGDGTAWEVSMLNTPCEAPGLCCYSCCCPCCSALTQRKELLEITGEKYICCAGLCPCGPCGQPQDENCLYAEVGCCLGMAISGNRWMLQTRFLKQNDPCDECLMMCSACLSCFACILQVAGADEDMANAVALLADCVACSVSGCMLTQQQVEVNKIKENEKNPTQNNLEKIRQFL